ncbi:MAG: TIGR04283 family arsenosugar biosynthesis glycosyltransferase [Bacteroidota bacterium]
MTKISIIIPTLNEAHTIGQLLHHLMENSTSSNIADIIVVDGGSTDGTRDLVKTYLTSRDVLDTKSSMEDFTRTDVRLLSSPKGRAIQMNLGAKNATGDVLYFLHADSFPPKDFDTYILNEVKRDNKAGCFRMTFNHEHWWLRLAGWLTQFPWRACRGGDQSQFITKNLFYNLGGFNENYIIYEDNDLISRLYAIDEFVVIQKKLSTSARCYEKHGIWRLQFHFWAIHLKHIFGSSAQDLHRYYQKHIAH